MSVSHSHNKCDNTPKTTVLLWSLLQTLNVPESKSNSPYSMFKLHTSDSISAILSKIPILTDIQLAITLSKMLNVDVEPDENKILLELKNFYMIISFIAVHLVTI